MKRLSSSDVCDAESFADYCQQVLGTPRPRTIGEWAALKKLLNKFFQDYPSADWRTMARLVHWCQGKHKRPASPWSILPMARYAWADGLLEEISPNRLNQNVQTQIDAILAQERDPQWRRMLIGASGSVAEEALDIYWRNHR